MKLLSLNERIHWAERNRRGQAITQAAWTLAKQAKIPLLSRVTVTAEYQPPDRRHRDAENICAPSAKYAIDGIKNAGCLIDDECPRYVAWIRYTIGPMFARGRLVLYVTEVGGAV